MGADSNGYVFINGRRVRMISTGGKMPVKKRSTTVAVDETPTSGLLAKPVKTTLTAKELRQFRDVLLQKRREIVGDLRSMEEAAFDDSGGDVSKLPLHMADVGSDVYAQDLNIGLAESELERLREIDDALARIQKKTYGMCLVSGKPIPAARLNAKPWAKFTIEAARMIERGLVPRS